MLPNIKKTEAALEAPKPALPTVIMKNLHRQETAGTGLAGKFLINPKYDSNYITYTHSIFSYFFFFFTILSVLQIHM